MDNSKVLSKLYKGKCTVYEYVSGTKKGSGLTTNKVEKVLYTDIPCRLSHNAAPSTIQTGLGANVAQSIKLFISKEYAIKEGSRIKVTQEGITDMYKACGKPNVYSSHQEVELELLKKWS